MENEIINFETIREEDGITLVSARELHEKLGSKRKFTDWIKPYVKKDNDYLFEENVDFTRIHVGVNPTNNVPIADYAITINMGKEISMLSRTEKGKEVRKYFINLEKENEELKEDNKALYEVAIADEDLTIREYEANRVKFAVRNIDRLLSDCDYTNIEKTVEDILDFHTNKLKKKDRYEYYRQMNDTEYKQLVRKKIKEKLDKLMINRQDLMLTMVGKTVQLKLENEAHTTTKKSTSHKKTCLTKKIDRLEQQIDKLTPVALSDMYCCNYHPFSWNYALKDGMRTDSYNRWLYYFPYKDFPSKEDMEAEGIDFSKPIRVILRCVHLHKFDTTNLSKTFIDAMFNDYRGVWKVDDCIVRGENLETLDFCDNYADGKMYWYIENFELEGDR